MYKILFIDEESEAFDYFNDYVEETVTSEPIEVICEYPLKNLDEMIELIIKSNPDVLITDFKLNEVKTDIKHKVLYNGVNLVKEFLSIRDGFPCFIMTSFDDDAVKLSDDVNLIYIKDILHLSEKKTNVKANFLEKVISQASHYKARIAKHEDELTTLIQRRHDGQTTLLDEQRIIELDNFLENAIDKKNAIPQEYKSLSNIEQLTEILSKVDDLLSRVEKK